MVKVLRSVWWWTGLILSGLTFWVIIGVMQYFDKDPFRYNTGLMFRNFGKFLIWLYPFWKLKIEGKMPNNPRKPYIVVCNHQSLVDIPIICCLSWDMKWLAKDELFKTPFLGTMMKASKDIPVQRDSKRGRLQALVQAMKTLEGKSSVILFPEGTRSPDGKVYGFMDSIFSIALEKKVDILPLAIDGSMHCLPKKTWMIQPAKNLRLKIFDPINISELKKDELNSKALSLKVRSLIINQIAKWRDVDVKDVDLNELRVT